MDIFKFLVSLVFQGKNLYRFLNSFHKSAAFSKNSVYLMLNGTRYNWPRFLHALSSNDMMIAHTTIVMTRFILTEWLRRNNNDPKTFGELFFILSDDIKDMDLTTALQNLISFVIKFIEDMNSVSTETVKNQLQQWIDQQASFIKALFNNFCWES